MTKYNLTAREKEVYYYLCKGYNNVQIAKVLSISSHTAKAHVGNILKKLGVENRVLAAYVAAQECLVDISRGFDQFQ